MAGRITLTIPLTTLADLADRPGEIAGIGPIDPWLARDLARAAARNPRSTWCVTVTDEQGHAIGHGCAKPEPTGHRKRRKPGSPDGRDPPGGTREGPGFAFNATGQHGPPGGYGSWRLSAGVGGSHLKVALEPIATDGCDHRYEAQGPRPWGQAAAPVPDAARHLYRAGLPAAIQPGRLRAQHTVRGWWQNVSVQWRCWWLIPFVMWRG
ncbi:MAG: hypothetical protein WBF34_17815 [Streptosporangiaceae bacterium]